MSWREEMWKGDKAKRVVALDCYFDGQSIPRCARENCPHYKNPQCSLTSQHIVGSKAVCEAAITEMANLLDGAEC